MRRTALLASVAAMAAALLIDATVAGQEPGPGTAFVAFRVDGNRVVATLKVMDTSAEQVRDGLSAEPMARFGYRYFDLPAPWREQGAADMRAGDRWLIHSAPGQAFQAETERTSEATQVVRTRSACCCGSYRNSRTPSSLCRPSTFWPNVL